jgi:mRNA interferase YafQ
VYRIEFTQQYLKDLRLARARNLDENKLNKVITILASGNNLPRKYLNHKLSGKFRGLNECHITPDWLLIYAKNERLTLITLIRTGTHEDLF